jgi:SAM-dependent methyltransferase
LGITNISAIRDDAFGELWKNVGGPTRADSPLRPFVTLQNNASGLILDLGPGSGSQLEFFKPEGVKAIYGAEPSSALHGPLDEAVKANGLSGKYHVVHCGAEKASLVPALKDIGLVQDGKLGVFDTIVCSKVLCSVPNQKDTIDGLYELLKPGGKLIMCEHIRNRCETPKGSILSRSIQIIFTFLGWPFFIGGCHLNRNTAQVMEAAAKKDGGWESAEVDYVVEYGSFPFAIGQFVKKA